MYARKHPDKNAGSHTLVVAGILVRVRDIYRLRTFGKTAGLYNAKTVEWAVKNDITNGKDNSLFGSNDPCTRGQIVTFLWRAAGSPAPKGTATFPADVLPGSFQNNAGLSVQSFELPSQIAQVLGGM